MTSQRIGYIRVSSLEQSTERQLDGIALDKVFTDKTSAKDTKRPQLQAAPIPSAQETSSLSIPWID